MSIDAAAKPMMHCHYCSCRVHCSDLVEACTLKMPAPKHDFVAGKEEEMMIKPAIFGTENVLNAVNASPSAKRVVLTASTASVWGDPHERGKGHVFTEADWNITAHPQRFPYFYSKTKAEERAYAMEKEAGGKWKLCSICPGAIWGPPTSSRTDGESVGQMIDLLSGEDHQLMECLRGICLVVWSVSIVAFGTGVRPAASRVA